MTNDASAKNRKEDMHVMSKHAVRLYLREISDIYAIIFNIILFIIYLQFMWG